MEIETTAANHILIPCIHLHSMGMSDREFYPLSTFIYLCNAFITEGCHLHYHDCGATCGIFMPVVCITLISTRTFHDMECTYIRKEAKISEYYKRT
jgi:hypothetical protein